MTGASASRAGSTMADVPAQLGRLPEPTDCAVLSVGGNDAAEKIARAIARVVRGGPGARRGSTALDDARGRRQHAIATMLGLQRVETSTDPTIRARVSRWVSLNSLRNAANLVAWPAALRAFSLPNHEGG